MKSNHNVCVFMHCFKHILLTFCFSFIVFTMQQKRKLRVFISNTYYPGKPDAEEEDANLPSWELRVEGRLLEDVTQSKVYIQIPGCKILLTN